MPEKTLGDLLLERNWRVVTAESCTGGLIGHRITNVAGSSAYFLLGLATYSNEAKEKYLGVSRAILDTEGAVSEPCARAMAEGARAAAGAEVGVATTGIAGPTGGTPDKPVGTVFMAVSVPAGTWVERHQFDGGREEIKAKTAEAALRLACRLIREEG
ncbi:MAG: CinA family protein [bacterium]|nr:CinA family protein [bacterium]